jgi:hypothetical protein
MVKGIGPNNSFATMLRSLPPNPSLYARERGFWLPSSRTSSPFVTLPSQSVIKMTLKVM